MKKTTEMKQFQLMYSNEYKIVLLVDYAGQVKINELGIPRMPKTILP
jgi:hypothetical protein